MQPEIASQGVEKGHIRVVDRDRDRFSVDVEGLHNRHEHPPASRRLGPFNDLPDVLFLVDSLKQLAFNLPG
jgi:hypothetical protein